MLPFLFSSRQAYQISIVPICANPAIASRYALTDASVQARVSALANPLLRAAIVKLAAIRFTSNSKLPRQRLVDLFTSEQHLPLRRGEHAEVRQVSVAAQLDVKASDRGVLQIRGHDLGRAPVEGERRDHHPAMTHRHQVRLTGEVLLLLAA